MEQETLKFLRLLSQRYPNIQTASSEIINLNAILNLPKGTEHFLSDLHGEYEAFSHILRNASGVIKRKIDEAFQTTLTQAERKTLATLIYYPRQKLALVKKEQRYLNDWYKITLYRLVEICRIIASKYTRSKVRKALPKDFEYIIEELLHEHGDVENKQKYYAGIIDTIIKTGRADAFITELAHLIQRLAIDRLHILGDIFDRGPGADLIMETLKHYHCVDVQWGNHDVMWMGAAAGSPVCIASVLRLAARYNNLDTVEDGYGISLRPLVTFAMEVYRDDPCECFLPETVNGSSGDSMKDLEIMAKIHKAIAVIQFKLEGEIIRRNPVYEMEDRLLLDKIDFEKGTLRLDGKEFPMKDTHFPTVQPENPYRLTPEETDVMEKLRTFFMHSEKLQEHIRFLYSKGGMYLKFNGNLLYHGCIPVEEDGAFMAFETEEGMLSGKALLDYADKTARKGYFLPQDAEEKQHSEDFLWYLGCGKKSPLFGKSKMSTFERYFIEEKEEWTEKKNAYYDKMEDATLCERILKEFGMDPATSHIINGHVPVKCKAGEKPIKANGKLFVIDGGLSKAYQATTGIAGYTLIYNSYGLLLTSHQPFCSRARAIEEEQDIHSSTEVVEKTSTRMRVADTDIGLALKSQIEELQLLLEAYTKGLIHQNE